MHLQNVSNPNKNIALSLDTVPKIVVSLCVKTNPIPAETEASVRSMHTVEVYVHVQYILLHPLYPEQALFFMPTVHTVDLDYFWDSAQFHFLSLLVWMFTNSYF